MLGKAIQKAGALIDLQKIRILKSTLVLYGDCFFSGTNIRKSMKIFFCLD